LRIPPANRLEALKGDRKGQHSVRSTTNGASAFGGTKATCMMLRLWTITDHEKTTEIHPGEVLLGEFLVPMKVSQNALARAAGVPPRRINEIVLGKRGVSADTAVRLARVFGTSERFWLGLQVDYDLEEARNAIGRDISNIDRIAA
jgi:addiction module HigA family antidote